VNAPKYCLCGYLVFLIVSVPAFSFGTESIDCYNDQYRLELLLNLNGNEISDFVFIVDDVKEDTQHWAVRERVVSVSDRIIKFRAESAEKSKILALDGKNEKETLTYGDKRYNLICDWSFFSQ